MNKFEKRYGHLRKFFMLVNLRLDEVFRRQKLLFSNMDILYTNRKENFMLNKSSKKIYSRK